MIIQTGLSSCYHSSSVYTQEERIKLDCVSACITYDDDNHIKLSLEDVEKRSAKDAIVL